jgi:glycosyltransferase involved in cell wall biosynthesis
MMISVLLAVHNGDRWLKEAIDSVRRQTLQDWELIVALNDCSDGSKEIAIDAQESDGRIRVLSIQDRGKNNAYNRAFEQSVGDFICFFACDDLLVETSLEVRVAPILRRGHQVFTTCLLEMISDDPRFDGIQVPRDGARPNYSGGCLMFSRELAQKIFPIPIKYPNEDTWVQLHLRLMGELEHIPSILYRYRIHSENSFGYAVSFDDKRDGFLRRMDCYTDFYDFYSGKFADSVFLQRELKPYVDALEFCRQRRLFRVLSQQNLALSQRLVLACYCHEYLYRLRTAMGRVLTGRTGQG